MEKISITSNLENLTPSQRRKFAKLFGFSEEALESQQTLEEAVKSDTEESDDVDEER